MSDLLNTLLGDHRLWRGHQQRTDNAAPEQTGFAALDDQLGGLGWPRGGLSECLLDSPGIGELQLVLPLIRRTTNSGRPVFWVNPPMTPYAPALAREGVNLDQLIVIQTESHADLLWTLENCLRSTATGLVIAWPGRLANRDIRRLQLAAETGHSPCVLFRPRQAASQSSPAALRLELKPDSGMALQVQVLKRRGGWPGLGCTLPMQARVLQDCQESSAMVIRGPWPDKPAAG